jgi:hypothetical protein
MEETDSVVERVQDMLLVASNFDSKPPFNCPLLMVELVQM